MTDIAAVFAAEGFAEVTPAASTRRIFSHDTAGNWGSDPTQAQKDDQAGRVARVRASIDTLGLDVSDSLRHVRAGSYNAHRWTFIVASQT